MKHNIKNLIIDLGVVLLNLSPERCYQKFREYGVTNIEQLAGTSYKSGLFYELEKGMISPEEFRNKLRELIGKDLTDEQIDAAWNSFLMDIPAYKLDLLLHLREKYMVYLLSNTNIIHWEWIKKHCFEYKGFSSEDFFEKIYLSFEMHQVKPDEGIFQNVLTDANLDPYETFLIDDAKENCLIAESFGIQTYAPKAAEDWRYLFDKLEMENGDYQRYR